MQTSDYYEQLRANGGEAPRLIDAERFFYWLEVLPPLDWTRGRDFECFRVSECVTGNLYTWAARLDGQHWEMIAPGDSTPAELLVKIYHAQRTAQA